MSSEKDRSVLGCTWKVRDKMWGPKIDGVSQIASNVATARGYDPERFFSSKLFSEMPDPSKFIGMDQAVSFFCDSVMEGKKIGVFGDYDVDGATSTALVMRWLRTMEVQAAFHIPDRMTEGYGPNIPAIKRLKEEEGCDVIVFVDCGTRAHAPLAYAHENNVQTIIIDHHEQDDKDPPGYFINPKRRDETKEFDYLCAAGMVFLFLIAVQREMRIRGFFNENRREVDLKNWLGIVALGTVCDVVPLKGLNRAYVVQGLKHMDKIAGIEALQHANAAKELDEKACGFVIGPCINAEGRIGDCTSGTRILMTDDKQEAASLAELLVETNRERQKMTNEAVEAAVNIAYGMSDKSTIVIYNEEWHPGIVGIVAGKVKDAVRKPTVVIGTGGTGSCRTVSGYDIGAAVDAALKAGLLDKGGGHKMAAGLHTSPNNVDALREFLCDLSKDFVLPDIEVDLEFVCGTLKTETLEDLEDLRPYGMGNPSPTFIIRDCFVTEVKILKKKGTDEEKHIKLMLNNKGVMEAAVWNVIGTPLGEYLRQLEGKMIDVYGHARAESFNGRKKATIQIMDVMIKGDSMIHDVAA